MLVLKESILKKYPYNTLSINLLKDIADSSIYSDVNRVGYTEVTYLYVVRAANSDRVLRIRETFDKLRLGMRVRVSNLPPEAPLEDYILMGAKYVVEKVFGLYKQDLPSFSRIVANILPGGPIGAFKMGYCLYVLSYIFVDDSIIDSSEFDLGEYSFKNVSDMSINWVVDKIILDNYVPTAQFNGKGN